MFETFMNNKIARKDKLKNKLKKIQEELGRLETNSLRCPNCLRWTWQMKTEPTYEKPKHISCDFVMPCTTCGFRSCWIETGFMGVCASIGVDPAKERGIDVQIGEIV